MIVMVQVADLSHENFKSSRVMRWWLSRLPNRFGAKSSRERKPRWLPGLLALDQMTPAQLKHCLQLRHSFSSFDTVDSSSSSLCSSQYTVQLIKVLQRYGSIKRYMNSPYLLYFPTSLLQPMVLQTLTRVKSEYLNHTSSLWNTKKTCHTCVFAIPSYTRCTNFQHPHDWGQTNFLLRTNSQLRLPWWQ